VLETKRQVADAWERTPCPRRLESLGAGISPAVAPATLALRRGRLARHLSREWGTPATAGEAPALAEGWSGTGGILLLEG
jgi:hypothetical protein